MILSIKGYIATAGILLTSAFTIHGASYNSDVYTDSDHTSNFRIGDGTFLYNEKPFVIKAAELHYPRIPEAYWEHRIEMCRALGMNTICLYVFWNVHEEREGEFDFSGNKNLRKFIELCAAHDMKVILRPGPYVCAEWEMGGLPWWLLKKKDIHLRENDPYFLERVDQFEKHVAEQVEGLMDRDGGPILMVQVENEYGSYGTDKQYVAQIRDMIRHYFGEDTVMFQCDWSSNFTENGLDDLLWTMNFGTGADIGQQFEHLRELRPHSPLMCSEYWSGWFDKWGANHETRPADDMIAGIREMLDNDISFSLYMTHGGTNFSHWAGANSPGYAPDVTSYDYDAPISESGRPTPKYHLLRSLLSNYSGDTPLPEIPDSIPAITIPEIHFSEVAPLWDNLGPSTHSDAIRTMEDFDQGFGTILYRTTLPQYQGEARLRVEEAHDYAQIFIDGEYIGTLDRRNAETELPIPTHKEGARLDILVEATGRINFGRAIKDYKGITDKVQLITTGENHQTKNAIDLKGWTISMISDDFTTYNNMDFQPLQEISDYDIAHDIRYPRGAYRATFRVSEIGDTFLDFSSWGKGLVYVNGIGIGRIWEIGPQQTLYLPGSLLHEGDNEIIVFDVKGPHKASTQGLDKPILNKIQNISDSNKCNLMHISNIKSDAYKYSDAFNAGNGWKRAMLPEITSGRYICLEAESGKADEENAAIAEIYLIGKDGERISREKWRAAGYDSQDAESNHTVDKVFDLQESTYWESASGTPYPHYIIIDLGGDEEIRGIEYLPRMESGAPGCISDYTLYIF